MPQQDISSQQDPDVLISIFLEPQQDHDVITLDIHDATVDHDAPP